MSEMAAFFVGADTDQKPFQTWVWDISHRRKIEKRTKNERPTCGQIQSP